MAFIAKERNLMFLLRIYINKKAASQMTFYLIEEDNWKYS